MKAPADIAKTLLLPVLGILLGTGFWLFEGSGAVALAGRAGAVPPTTFFDPPVFVGSLESPSDEPPYALAVHDGRLLVSYSGSNRIDEFSEDLVRVRSMDVPGDTEADITGLAIDAERLLVIDHRTGELILLAYDTGGLLQAYGTLPDGMTRLSLYGLAVVGGIAYVSDAGLRQVLAISTADIPGIREAGELILAFPGERPGGQSLGAPTFTMVTPDGRLLVSDRGDREVRVFSCNGRPMQSFRHPETGVLQAPMGIAMDDLVSPSLRAVSDTLFDPSGLLSQGRVHIADAVAGCVYVYDAAGQFVLAYGEELEHPNGIAIDQNRRLIFIADAGKRAVMIYKY